jgi:hypothetical protein
MYRNVSGKITIDSYDFSGKLLQTLPSIPNMGDAVKYDAFSGTLIVIDTVEEQVVFLDPVTGKEINRFGDAGGVYSGSSPGANVPSKFSSLKDVGVDASGCLYTASDRHLILRKYCSRAGARPTAPAEWKDFLSKFEQKWEISNLLFQEVADMGRANSSQVYLYDRRMTVDWSMDPSTVGFWKYDGSTVNPKAWPWDPRLFGLDYTTWVRGLASADGEKHDILYTTPAGAPLGVYRTTNGPGTTTPPCAVFSATTAKTPVMPGMPTAGSWLWQDKNGDETPTADEYLQFPVT